MSLNPNNDAVHIDYGLGDAAVIGITRSKVSVATARVALQIGGPFVCEGGVCGISNGDGGALSVVKVMVHYSRRCHRRRRRPQHHNDDLLRTRERRCTVARNVDVAQILQRAVIIVVIRNRFDVQSDLNMVANWLLK
ncbi:Hypothetical predicted protein [Olea europaea subsp. europaea]|uniref:Uncharacterized protein n=1 Tax=Olea europaea subsp. europaea TaxID=158383 RepID=A0A8S0Q5I4_OLEEU|nr:Hypothetical predicted protein [Olea europaea subsp. europaea]